MGQFSYNASVIKANELYKYYVSIGDMNAAMKIMNLLRRLLNRLRGIPYKKARRGYYTDRRLYTWRIWIYNND